MQLELVRLVGSENLLFFGIGFILIMTSIIDETDFSEKIRFWFLVIGVVFCIGAGMGMRSHHAEILNPNLAVEIAGNSAELKRGLASFDDCLNRHDAPTCKAQVLIIEKEQYKVQDTQALANAMDRYVKERK